MVLVNLHAQDVSILDVKQFVYNFYVWEDVENIDMICMPIWLNIIVVSVNRGSMIRLNKRNLGVLELFYICFFYLMNNSQIL